MKQHDNDQLVQLVLESERVRVSPQTEVDRLEDEAIPRCDNVSARKSKETKQHRNDEQDCENEKEVVSGEAEISKLQEKVTLDGNTLALVAKDTRQQHSDERLLLARATEEERISLSSAHAL